MTVRNKRTRFLLDPVEGAAELERRRAQLFAPHVAPLNRLVEQIRAETTESVPWFDPRHGGCRAKVLVLAQDPSGAASEGSGFISPDNNDPSAQNATIATEAAGLQPRELAHWNVVPWWVANPAKKAPGRTLTSEAQRASRYLDRVFELVPDVRVVLLLGKHAQKAWPAYERRSRHRPAQLCVLPAPHPGPQAWNIVDAVTHRKNSVLTVEAFCRAKAIVDDRSAGTA